MKQTVSKFVTLCLVSLFLCTAASAQTPPRRILFEEFSTAPCGFCPDGDVIAKQIIADHPSVIWVTHHAGFGTDSMTTPHSVTIANAFVNFAPSGVFDRVLYPAHVAPYNNLGTMRSKWDSLVTAHLADEQYGDVRITSTYTATTSKLDVRVDVEFAVAPPAGDLRLHLFIIEDSVVGRGPGYDQVNYFNGTTGHPFYRAGDPVIGYAHHRVVSDIPTGAWGVSGVIPQTPVTGTTYSWTWSGDLRTVWDKSNTGRHDVISLVAFVGVHHLDPLRRRVVTAGDARITNVILDAPGAPLPPSTPVLTAWPQPAADQVTLTATGLRHTGLLVVTDAMGREVARLRLEPGSPHAVVSTRSLPAGTYLARLVTPTEVRTGRILVLR